MTHSELRRHLASALAAFLEAPEAEAECVRWFEDGLGLNRAWLAAHGEDSVPEGRRAQIEAWLARRQQGEPWAYLLGWAWFRDRRFQVNSATLIPRPETELLVRAALDLGRRLGVTRCVDVGTGSGIIAISLALETDWNVDAVDLSPDALVVARSNAASLGAPVRFHEGSLLDPVGDPLGLVVANLPYVDPADAPSLQRELSFEPDLALFASERGLALSRQLLTTAAQRKAAACLLEIGAGQGPELIQHALASGWREASVGADWAGHDRVLVAQT